MITELKDTHINKIQLTVKTRVQQIFHVTLLKLRTLFTLAFLITNSMAIFFFVVVVLQQQPNNHRCNCKTFFDLRSKADFHGNLAAVIHLFENKLH